MECIQLSFIIPLKSHKICLVVFLDDLLDEKFLNLGRYRIVTFPYQHDKVLQEVGLFDVQLFLLNLEWVHGDRMLLGVADIFTSYILTESFVGVTCIDHDNVSVLFPKLTYHTVHVERFT